MVKVMAYMTVAMTLFSLSLAGWLHVINTQAHAAIPVCDRGITLSYYVD